MQSPELRRYRISETCAGRRPVRRNLDIIISITLRFLDYFTSRSNTDESCAFLFDLIIRDERFFGVSTIRTGDSQGIRTYESGDMVAFPHEERVLAFILDKGCDEIGSDSRASESGYIDVIDVFGGGCDFRLAADLESFFQLVHKPGDQLIHHSYRSLVAVIRCNIRYFLPAKMPQSGFPCCLPEKKP